MDSTTAISDEMQTMVVDDPSQFTQLFDRLTVLQEQVETECSEEVYGPLSEGVYSLAKANAGYTACDFLTLCNKKKVERDVIDGTTSLGQAATAAIRTE